MYYRQHPRRYLLILSGLILLSRKQLILFMKSIQMMLLSRSSMITGSLLSAGYSMTTA